MQFWSIWLSLLVVGSVGVNAKDPVEITDDDPVVPGIYQELVEEEPIFYTSYVPILFEFKKPNWNDLSLNWSALESCSNESIKNNATSGALCPFGYYLKEITGNLSHVFNTQLLSLPDFNTSTNTSPKAGSGNLVDVLSCEKISPHFKASLSGEIDVESYLSALNTCSFIRETLINRTLAPRDMTFLRPIFNSTFQAFNVSIANFEKYGGPLESKGDLLNLYTTLKSILIENLIMDDNRWNNAFSTCASNKFPRMIVNEDELRNALAQITKTVVSMQLELSIPLDQLSKFYDLKLTDCSFTTRQTYMIRLLVPVKPPQAHSFKLNKLHTLPSIYETDLGSKLCEPTNLPLNQVLEINNDARYPVSCQDDLCYVSVNGPSSDLPPDNAFKCAQGLAKNQESVISKYCLTRIQCSLFDPNDSPYYKQLTANTVFVSVVNRYEDFNISIICNDNKVLQTFDVNKNSSEFIITIPCACHLQENRRKVFTPSAPCRNITVKTSKLQKFSLPGSILQPKYLLPNESTVILTELKTRMQKLETALEEATQQSLNALSNRGLYVALIVMLLIATFILSLWALQLWRWKRSVMARRNNYVMFDQASMLQDDAAL